MTKFSPEGKAILTAIVCRTCTGSGTGMKGITACIVCDGIGVELVDADGAPNVIDMFEIHKQKVELNLGRG